MTRSTCVLAALLALAPTASNAGPSASEVAPFEASMAASVGWRAPSPSERPVRPRSAPRIYDGQLGQGQDLMVNGGWGALYGLGITGVGFGVAFSGWASTWGGSGFGLMWAGVGVMGLGGLVTVVSLALVERGAGIATVRLRALGIKQKRVHLFLIGGGLATMVGGIAAYGGGPYIALGGAATGAGLIVHVTQASRGLRTFEEEQRKQREVHLVPAMPSRSPGATLVGRF